MIYHMIFVSTPYFSNSQNSAVWANLGLLYLQNNDPELANEAFYRAQTLDPDYTLAWVGQGLVATVNGHEGEAKALFEHAVSLTADVVSDLAFILRIYVTLQTSSSPMPTWSTRIEFSTDFPFSNPTAHLHDNFFCRRSSPSTDIACAAPMTLPHYTSLALCANASDMRT